MFSNSKGFSAKFVEGFSRLFDTSAMSYERHAQRISKQILTIAPRASSKRSNGK
ncbi:hypothetical protein PS710_00484 [Pseudomonas fluorescens]|uniref:Uncharacterized protein n=1 Tax=Pseudomonas fluorescens TaxID=294 RepID=A0A5E7A9C5_PSEFL|nr:hypothetical protein PS710_00484 [Pseudomonas fluorescens]